MITDRIKKILSQADISETLTLLDNMNFLLKGLLKYNQKLFDTGKL